MSDKKSILEREQERKEALSNQKFQKEFLKNQNLIAKARNEQMKAVVEEQELSSRSWKAHYEKMYFTVASYKIESEYNEVKQLLAEREAEEKAKALANQQVTGESHTITQEDLDNNPELVEAGVVVGDEGELGPEVNPNEVNYESEG